MTAAVPSNEWEPCHECDLRLFGDLKLDGPHCFLLDNGRSIPDRTTRPKVLDSQSDAIPSTELAIDGEIEQRQLSDCPTHFETNSDRSYIFRLKRPLLANENTFVPWISGTQYGGFHDEVSATPPTAPPN